MYMATTIYVSLSSSRGFYVTSRGGPHYELSFHFFSMEVISVTSCRDISDSEARNYQAYTNLELGVHLHIFLSLRVICVFQHGNSMFQSY